MELMSKHFRSQSHWSSMMQCFSTAQRDRSRFLSTGSSGDVAPELPHKREVGEGSSHPFHPEDRSSFSGWSLSWHVASSHKRRWHSLESSFLGREGYRLDRWHSRRAEQDTPTSDSLCQQRPEPQTWELSRSAPIPPDTSSTIFPEEKLGLGLHQD